MAQEHHDFNDVGTMYIGTYLLLSINKYRCSGSQCLYYVHKLKIMMYTVTHTIANIAICLGFRIQVYDEYIDELSLMQKDIPLPHCPWPVGHVIPKIYSAFKF